MLWSVCPFLAKLLQLVVGVLEVLRIAIMQIPIRINGSPQIGCVPRQGAALCHHTGTGHRVADRHKAQHCWCGTRRGGGPGPIGQRGAEEAFTSNELQLVLCRNPPVVARLPGLPFGITGRAAQKKPASMNPSIYTCAICVNTLKDGGAAFGACLCLSVAGREGGGAAP